MLSVCLYQLLWLYINWNFIPPFPYLWSFWSLYFHTEFCIKNLSSKSCLSLIQFSVMFIWLFTDSALQTLILSNLCQLLLSLPLYYRQLFILASLFHRIHGVVFVLGWKYNKDESFSRLVFSGSILNIQILGLFCIFSQCLIYIFFFYYGISPQVTMNFQKFNSFWTHVIVLSRCLVLQPSKLMPFCFFKVTTLSCQTPFARSKSEVVLQLLPISELPLSG